MQIQKLIQTWCASADQHSFRPGATDRELELAESELGFPLPDSLRELYQFSNGLYLLQGNLQFLPLQEADGQMGLSTAAIKLRQWDWQLPSEVLAFGNNGCDEQLGIWLPEIQSSTFKHPILEIGEIFEPKSMAIVATDFVPFLAGRTAYYLMAYEADRAALDVLGLPNSLRFEPDEMGEDVFARLRRWADPHLPDPNPDPYRNGYDVEGLKKIFAL